MCHYVVPTRPVGEPGDEPSGRYADEAFAVLLERITAAGTLPGDYTVKMFGGGSQFGPVSGPAMDVAGRNVDAGLRLLRGHGLVPTSMHLGGTGHRQVVLDTRSGDVWVRHVERAPGLDV